MVILDDLAEMFRLHRKICWLHNFACITVCHHLVPEAGVYVMGFTVHEKYIGKFRKIFNTRSQETVDVCLEMLANSFLNKFCAIHYALCRVFVAIAKTELESCYTEV